MFFYPEPRRIRRKRKERGDMTTETPDYESDVDSLKEWAAFQQGVDVWMDECFGAEIKTDQLERADRFIEEALELSQTFPDFGAERAHALVDYVFSRTVGNRPQEVGGVMVTLAALCNASQVSIEESARAELARVWTKVDQIRAKQAAKPKGSALPVKAFIEATSPSALIAEVERLRKACRDITPYLNWTISDESPGHHPTMPSAVAAFIEATSPSALEGK